MPLGGGYLSELMSLATEVVATSVNHLELKAPGDWQLGKSLGVLYYIAFGLVIALPFLRSGRGLPAAAP